MDDDLEVEFAASGSGFCDSSNVDVRQRVISTAEIARCPGGTGSATFFSSPGVLRCDAPLLWFDGAAPATRGRSWPLGNKGLNHLENVF